MVSSRFHEEIGGLISQQFFRAPALTLDFVDIQLVLE
jgi:hypothetical protein